MIEKKPATMRNEPFYIVYRGLTLWASELKQIVEIILPDNSLPDATYALDPVETYLCGIVLTIKKGRKVLAGNYYSGNPTIAEIDEELTEFLKLHMIEDGLI